MTTLLRYQWEEPQWSIAAHTRSPAVDPSELEYITLHYPGAAGITSSMLGYVRATQRSYVTARGYPIGYSWGYWLDGVELELRGWDYRNAANAANDPEDVDENRISVALWCIVEHANPANAMQVPAIRERVRHIWDRCGHRLPLIGHGDLEATPCPGAGMRDQLRAGVFLPRPDKEDDDMANRPPPEVIKHGRHGATYIAVDGHKVWLDNGHAAQLAIARYGGLRDVDEIECASFGPILGPIPAGHDPYGRVKKA